MPLMIAVSKNLEVKTFLIAYSYYPSEDTESYAFFFEVLR